MKQGHESDSHFGPSWGQNLSDSQKKESKKAKRPLRNKQTLAQENDAKKKTRQVLTLPF